MTLLRPLTSATALLGGLLAPSISSSAPADIYKTVDENGVISFTNTPKNGGKLYAKDIPRYVKTCPGIGVKAAEWLIAKDPMLLGADNWPVETAPPTPP